MNEQRSSSPEFGLMGYPLAEATQPRHRGTRFVPNIVQSVHRASTRPRMIPIQAKQNRHPCQEPGAVFPGPGAVFPGHATKPGAARYGRNYFSRPGVVRCPGLPVRTDRCHHGVEDRLYVDHDDFRFQKSRKKVLRHTGITSYRHYGLLGQGHGQPQGGG